MRTVLAGSERNTAGSKEKRRPSGVGETGGKGLEERTD